MIVGAGGGRSGRKRSGEAAHFWIMQASRQRRALRMFRSDWAAAGGRKGSRRGRVRAPPRFPLRRTEEEGAEARRAPGRRADAGGELRRQGEVLLLRDVVEEVDHLRVRGGGDADRERAAADGVEHLGDVVAHLREGIAGRWGGGWWCVAGRRRSGRRGRVGRAGRGAGRAP